MKLVPAPHALVEALCMDEDTIFVHPRVFDRLAGMHRPDRGDAELCELSRTAQTFADLLTETST